MGTDTEVVLSCDIKCHLGQGIDQVSVDSDVKEPAASWVPIMKKFHGTANWPTMTVILPGELYW